MKTLGNIKRKYKTFLHRQRNGWDLPSTTLAKTSVYYPSDDILDKHKPNKVSWFNQSGAGFTLIELMVVIAIIGILSSIGLVSLNGAREKARDAKRVSDLDQIRTALILYYDNNNEQFPPSDYIAQAAAVLGVLVPAQLSALPTTPLMAESDFGDYWYISNAAEIVAIPGVIGNYRTYGTFALVTKLESNHKWYIINSQGVSTLAAPNVGGDWTMTEGGRDSVTCDSSTSGTNIQEGYTMGIIHACLNSPIYSTS